MYRYYVNKKAQPNGDNEVHREDCDYLPSIENREYWGVFSNCQNAVAEAKRRYIHADGCKFCCFKCHSK